MADDVIIHACIIYLHKKLSEEESFQVADMSRGWWGGGGGMQCLGRTGKLHALSPIPCPMHLFTLAVSEMNVFIINLYSSKQMFSCESL